MYALIGYPVKHSFSQKYFSKKFQNENIDEKYHLFSAQNIDIVNRILNENADLKGANVTLPYKEKIIPLLSELSEDAEEIGAVNCIKFIKSNNNEKLHSIGYNTDWRGFSLSLLPFLDSIGNSALVFGSGGASKAICYALKKLNITPTVVSRTPQIGQLDYCKINEDIIKGNLLLVNTTPLGMYPNIDSFPPVPYQFLSKKHLCYDLVYNPLDTLFMKKARTFGARVKNGLEMLYNQAEMSWKIWND